MDPEIAWTRRAKADLAAIWLESSDRDEIAACSHEAEERIRRDPAGCGESRSPGRRVVGVGYIAVGWIWNAESRRAIIYAVRVSSRG